MTSFWSVTVDVVIKAQKSLLFVLGVWLLLVWVTRTQVVDTRRTNHVSRKVRYSRVTEDDIRFVIKSNSEYQRRKFL